MHIYTAAVYSNAYMPGMNRYVKLTEREKDVVHTLPHILESWHYVGKQTFVDHMRNNGAKVFLDSGAFSAWTLNVELRVEDYCDYITRNWDILRVDDGCLMASVLDGIGDPAKTLANQNEMEYLLQAKWGKSKTAAPLPCFHFGEPIEYLKYYVDRYEYITIGGMVGKTPEQLREWLSDVWEYMLDGSGRAKLKVHGFGLTSVPLMDEFDWYSVDSSSWIQSAAFGGVVTPRWGPISVSAKSPNRHTAGRHLTTFTPPQIDAIVAELYRTGFPYDRLADVYESRAAYNLWAFGEINEQMNDTRRDNYRRGKQIDLLSYIENADGK